MIGDAALREIVGADALGAVAGTDLALAVRRTFALHFLAFDIVKPRAQNLHGLGAVLMLGFLRTGDDQTRRKMGDTNGGVGGVDVLAARTGSTHRIDANVFRANFDVDVFRFRQHGNRGGRGVDAAARFRFRHALHPVYAGFELQLGKYPSPADRGDDFFVTARFTLAGGKHFDFPPLGRCEALIHAEEITGEKCGLGPSRTGADFKDRAFFVRRILRKQQDLHVLFKLADAALDFRQLHFRQVAHILVGRLVSKQRLEIGGLGNRLLVFADFLHHRLEFGIFRSQLHINIRCRPGRHTRFDLAETSFQLAHFFDGKLRHQSLQY
ncbi:hypothetical protein D3C86_1314880 [compost metagenome]